MLDNKTNDITTAANNDTDAQTAYFGTAGAKAGNIQYDAFATGQVSAEHAFVDTNTIEVRSRDQYITLFKKTEERTARATLQMCRVVYEAQQTLAEHDFADFCAAVGYTDTSATIRKFCAIGKLQPRLVKHAALMPPEWTKIYTLTQLPAQMFENYVDKGTDFRGLTGKQIKQLVNATRSETTQFTTLLPKDRDSNNFVFAKVSFNKTFVDALDWRAVKKALAEVESRLPIKVQFVAAAEEAYQHTVAHRYAQAKQKAKDVEFTPSLWDYGTEASQENLKAASLEAKTVDGTVERQPTTA